MENDIFSYLVVALVFLWILQQFVEGKKKLFFFASCIMLMLVLALRDAEYGVIDMLRYSRYYERFVYTNHIKDALWFSNGKDMGFWIILYVFSSLGLSFQLFVSIISVVTISVWGWYINKYSPNTLISCFILLGSGCYTFMFYGLRQVVAFTLILLCIDACYEKKIRKSIFFLIFAISCHWSSVGVLPVLFIARRKFNTTIIVTYFITFVIVLLFSTQIGYLITYLFKDDYVDVYKSSGGVSGLAIIYLTLLLWYFFVFKDKLVLNYKNSFFMHAFVILCIIQICSTYAYSFTRLNFFYLFSILTVTVPMSLSSKNLKCLISGNGASFVSSVLSGLLIALLIYLFFIFIRGNRLENYIFFWQST